MWEPSPQDIANRDTLNALRREGRSPYAIFFPGGFRGCLGCLPVVVVLSVAAVITGTIIGHHIYGPKKAHPNHLSQHNGQYGIQKTTLLRGDRYAIDGLHLRRAGHAVGSEYLVRMTRSGLSFAGIVNVITAPASATGGTNPCGGLDLLIRSGPRTLPWAKLKPGTRLCTQPRDDSGAYDYVITIDKLAGKKLMVNFVVWDESAASRTS